jgi:hypothetical protein
VEVDQEVFVKVLLVEQVELVVIELLFLEEQHYK